MRERHLELTRLLETDAPYELRSRLVTVEEALRETSVDLLAPVFLRLLAQENRHGPG
ncbi:hypothetical protein ACGFJC_09655 [Nonomuraea fuscirosea]|uniref:hypothetical protein n=1 Tax=Nonomuraea fuscirosea TaxID=1291556 RepID=UPI003712B5AA